MRLGDDGSDNFIDRTGRGGLGFGGGGGGNLLGCLIPLVASRFGMIGVAGPAARLLRAAEPRRRRQPDPRRRQRHDDQRAVRPVDPGARGAARAVRRAGVDREGVGRDLPASRPDLPAAADDRLFEHRPVGLRSRPGGDGAVLLPDRPAGSTSTRNSSTSSAAASRRPAISPRPMSSRTRSATTSRTSKARSTARSGAGAGRPHRGQPDPGRGRAAGRLLCGRVGGQRHATRKARSSSPATSRKACAPPKRSATTRCRSRCRAGWCRKASPTAARRSAWKRSAADCRAATRRAATTRARL